MANPEHLSILNQGITHWNRWIRKNLYKITPDLSEADLSDADLTEADLRGVNLSCTDLSNANLSEADLMKADLSNADLTRANLSEADLSDADLRGTRFNKANLSRANLSGANLSGANLSKACIEDWNINLETNLKNIRCDCVFLGSIFGGFWTDANFMERYPQQENEIFKPGEFEKLVRNSQNTIDLTVNQEIN